MATVIVALRYTGLNLGGLTTINQKFAALDSARVVSRDEGVSLDGRSFPPSSYLSEPAERPLEVKHRCRIERDVFLRSVERDLGDPVNGNCFTYA